MILSIILIEELALETSQYARPAAFRQARRLKAPHASSGPPRGRNKSAARPKPGRRRPAIKIWLAELAASLQQRARGRRQPRRPYMAAGRPRPVCASNSLTDRRGLAAPHDTLRQLGEHQNTRRTPAAVAPAHRRTCALRAGSRARLKPTRAQRWPRRSPTEPAPAHKHRHAASDRPLAHTLKQTPRVLTERCCRL